MEIHRPSVESNGAARRKRRSSYLQNGKYPEQKKSNATPLSDITKSTLNTNQNSHTKSTITYPSPPYTFSNLSKLPSPRNPTTSKPTKVVSEQGSSKNFKPFTTSTPIGSNINVHSFSSLNYSIKNKAKVQTSNFDTIHQSQTQSTNFTQPTNLSSNLIHSNYNVRKYVPGQNLLNKFSATIPLNAKYSPCPKVGTKRAFPVNDSEAAGNVNIKNRKAKQSRIQCMSKPISEIYNDLLCQLQTRHQSTNNVLHLNGFVPQTFNRGCTSQKEAQSTVPAKVQTFKVQPTPTQHSHLPASTLNNHFRSQVRFSKPTQLPHLNSKSCHSNDSVRKYVHGQNLLPHLDATVQVPVLPSPSLNVGEKRPSDHTDTAQNINVKNRRAAHNYQRSYNNGVASIHTSPPEPSHFNVNPHPSAQTSGSTHRVSNKRKHIETDAEYFETMSDRLPHGTQDDSGHASSDVDSDADSDATDQTQSDTSSDADLEINDDNEAQGYGDIGQPSWECEFCGALMWYQERRQKSKNTTKPKFQLCCQHGKVQLPLLEQPPQLLQHLLFDNQSKTSKNYQNNARTYNAMFSFTSPGMKMDSYTNKGKGPPVLRMQGQTCHRIGSMLPLAGQRPKFAQLYIHDTDNEISNRIGSFRDNKDIDEQLVKDLRSMLDANNVHAKAFRMARDLFKSGPVQNVRLKLIADRNTDGRVYNKPTVSEVAALIAGDIDSAKHRDIILQGQTGNLQRIDEFHASYLGFQYPLLFPYGEDGYRPGILLRYKDDTVVNSRNRLTIKAWFCFRIQSRKFEANTLYCSRRLFQQFLVDGYAMMEAERLNWLRKNQSKLRVGKYRQLSEKTAGQNQSQQKLQGKRVVLPSTFVGSKRYMDQLYFDGMAISSAVGFPDIFITFTCNPNWPEITRELAKFNLKPQDRPDIIARVFKIKFDELMKDLTKNHTLGKVLAYMYTIEFQKRGLPHAHILIFLHPSSKYPTPADIDKIISAEIPDPKKHNDLYNLVKSHMIHGPCGLARLSSPCMGKNNKCSKFFPKKYIERTIVDQDGYPVYKRSSNTHTIIKNGITLDNRHVVPYNKKLLMKYQAHINMEWCNQSASIKYLFKYIHKGYDRITARIVPTEQNVTSQGQPIDEIKHYLDCRYISPAEACWRILSFSIHGRKPAVERMFFHLVGEKCIYFTDHSTMENVLEKASVTESMFTAWLQANQEYEAARQLTYGQFVSKFVYSKKNRIWTPRKRGYTIGRLIWVPPTTGELFYLRMMLTIVKGPKTYEEIRKVGDIQFLSFREACFAMGFLNDDMEFIGAIREAYQWGSGYFLRRLFVIMLLSGAMNRPRHVWNKTIHWLSDGILREQRNLANNQELMLSEEQIQNLTLIEIEKLLQSSRRTLKDFASLPYPNGYVLEQLGNRLIYDERSYDIGTLQTEFQDLFSSLTDEQRVIFDKIMLAVTNQKGGVFFLHGYGGTGKTFMWRTLASALRSKHEIVLTVASSGIASLLLPGGRTAHSKFKMPVPTLDNSMCNIDHDSDMADLLRQTKLIIWDEAPMSHRYTFECLDRTLKDIMGDGIKKSELIFGGKVVVFGGDFRQILPVIPRANRSDIVHASINSSYIWDHCQVLELTKNMRLKHGSDPKENEEIEEFSNWLLRLGEGRINEPNDGYAEIPIPKDMLLTEYEDPILAIVQSTYPNFLDNYKSYDYLKSRAILASTIEVVDQINDYVLGLMPGEERVYFSANSIDRSEMHDSTVTDVLTPEFLSTLRTSGLPNHSIKLKVGCPIMLLRNIDQAEGLCNGTRLIVTKMATHVLEAKIMGGKHHGNIIYIPRMDMSPSQSPWPFKLCRRQFPIVVSYSMTINKSQGQSLDWVGLYLPKDVFSHGQIYVAISRVTSKKGIKILIHDEHKLPKDTTTNVVYKEIFENV